MSSKQERKADQSTNQSQEDTAPVPEQPSESAAEASSKAAGTVDAIDEVLEEFDDLTLEELGFRKDDKIDSAVIDEAIAKKIAQNVQKGGE
ncbi:hypothetical protein K7472_19705 [Streptomyces sp. PTM05]|uniref:Uncharacterized protein n=1 Tax=Streptantibioticus parmotrematis TaxID=2873249 RepID=A0ABS7QWI9_9ACTN|nr:hypothetical protein [Streptantibioticus parmotrematis]MBY8887056.1 hypothetical protein [Streptantibioticus parmotrematis]